MKQVYGDDLVVEGDLDEGVPVEVFMSELVKMSEAARKVGATEVQIRVREFTWGADVRVFGERPETPDELKAREQLEENQAAEHRANRREHYLKLKAEFEPGDKTDG